MDRGQVCCCAAALLAMYSIIARLNQDYCPGLCSKVQGPHSFVSIPYMFQLEAAAWGAPLTCIRLLYSYAARLLLGCMQYTFHVTMVKQATIRCSVLLLHVTCCC
ncbi:hypothetical protein COO60DRAFT_1510283 [Scenedesmus sp. NREL 46B-D3]|nr:hypothetical protein COO60DRAFT_1510283 [Scenedesmus sp. NREL 46B-D3]